MDVGIVGMGFYVPKRVRGNEEVLADIKKVLENSNHSEKEKWLAMRPEGIERISGVRERRVAAEGETTSDMAAEAAKKALEDAEMSPGDIDAVFVATVTGDCVTPATACFVQEKIGISKEGLKMIPGDFNGACAGAVGVMRLAKALIKNNEDDCQNILVIGAERLSTLIAPSNPESYILFGDGAGAVVLRKSSRMKLLRFSGGGDGSKTEIIKLLSGASLIFLGGGVFRFAVQKLSELTSKLMELIGKDAHDLSLVIPHQANLRIIEAARIRLGLPPEKVFVNIDKYGNTSAPSAIIALCEAREQGRLKKGDLLAMTMFGAGLVWEGCLIEV